MEPSSRAFRSGRLKLHFWDFGTAGNPVVVLLHGWLDHARNWDWVAESLRDRYHVYALDLRGHGDSEWSSSGLYTPAEFVLDLAKLLDLLDAFPVRLVGHCLGGGVVLQYAGLYPDRVEKVISIEGIGLPFDHHNAGAASGSQVRAWMEGVRHIERHPPKMEPTLEAAIDRLRSANPRLTQELARHLTRHGTTIATDGAVSWKSDSYARVLAPYGYGVDEAIDVLKRISAPTLVIWGANSFVPIVEDDPRLLAIRDRRFVSIPNAGHWVYHDQLDAFTATALGFLDVSSDFD